MKRAFHYCVAVLALVMTSPLRGDVIWSNGFESGVLNPWQTTGTNWSIITSTVAAHSGAKGLDVRGIAVGETGMLSAHIPSSGYQDIEWSYWYKIRDALEQADIVTAEWSPDGSNWQTLVAYTEVPVSEWQVVNFILPTSANDNPDLWLRFRAELNTALDRMSFDDMILAGTTLVPEPSTCVVGLGLLGILATRRQR